MCRLPTAQLLAGAKWAVGSYEDPLSPHTVVSFTLSFHSEWGADN